MSVNFMTTLVCGLSSPSTLRTTKFDLVYNTAIERDDIVTEERTSEM